MEEGGEEEWEVGERKIGREGGQGRREKEREGGRKMKKGAGRGEGTGTEEGEDRDVVCFVPRGQHRAWHGGGTH